MTQAREILVVKRGGDVEPFALEKLGRCIRVGLLARGDDPVFASPLARAIEVHVEGLGASRRPTSDYLFKCATTVLRETGMGEVARALAEHRRGRALARRRVRVRTADSRPQGDRWDKARLAAWLERHCDLRRATARLLAGEVERRVLKLEYEVIAGPLVRELILSELGAWGLAEPGAVAPPRH